MQRMMSQRTNSKKTSPFKYNQSSAANTQSSNSAVYFCHYKNAMYMGGIKAFKKDGRGILIHDCGLSIFTSYLNDQMHGNNIFFAQHCLISTEYIKGKLVEAVYRTDGYLGHFNFNNEGIIEGKCHLLNFT